VTGVSAEYGVPHDAAIDSVSRQFELAREPVSPLDVARHAQALERPAGGLDMRPRSVPVPPVTGEVGQF
jgi:hypothetical protein